MAEPSIPDIPAEEEGAGGEEGAEAGDGTAPSIPEGGGAGDESAATPTPSSKCCRHLMLHTN